MSGYLQRGQLRGCACTWASSERPGGRLCQYLGIFREARVEAVPVPGYLQRDQVGRCALYLGIFREARWEAVPCTWVSSERPGGRLFRRVLLQTVACLPPRHCNTVHNFTVKSNKDRITGKALKTIKIEFFLEQR